MYLLAPLQRNCKGTALNLYHHKLAQSRLSEFLTRANQYGKERGFVRSTLPTVSQLSPFIRYRFLHEREIFKALIETYPFSHVEKFIQELVWRSYWRGWLIQRPAVWDHYEQRVNELLPHASQSFPLYTQAIEGKTHLSFFNDWVYELKETGYLHNHVRMWFASVWYFTFQLPWELGAHWMYDHLLDGDPASNTLSWRWIVGLQTPGKTYLATPHNIHHFSEGRWSPSVGDLATEGTGACEDAQIRRETHPFVPHAYSVSESYSPLILSTEQLTPPEQWIGPCLYLSSDLNENTPQKESWRNHLLQEAALRYSAEEPLSLERLTAHLQQLDTKTAYMLRPQPGKSIRWLRSVINYLEGSGFKLLLIDDPWDQKLFPMAKKGFFPFWKQARKWLESEALA